MRLRPDQEQVCKYRSGYMAVPAIPGAGKTFTLAVLATQLIKEEKHKPGKILVVTYMNSAVSNFKTRIGSMLEQEGLPRNKGYEVMTLHSLAMKIIREKPGQVLISGEFEILEDISKDRLLHKLVNEWISRNSKRFYSFVDYREGESTWQRNRKTDAWLKKFTRVVSEMIPYFKCKGCSSQELLAHTDSSKNSLLRCVTEIYANYEAELKRKGLLDFDDIICKAIEVLKVDEDLREKVQKRYTYVFEDEAQDSSSLQEEMLLMISGGNKNLVRVGDSNQSIMSSFTVSDPKLFKQYCARDDVQKKKIECASRSTKEIINMANFLVEWSQELHPTPECRSSLENQRIREVEKDDLFPNPVTDSYTIGARVYDTREEEIRDISKRADRYARDNSDKTIAILVPTNYVIDEFKEQLDLLGARYREVTSFPAERARAALIIGTVLDFTATPYDSSLFYKLLETCFMEELQQEQELSSFREFIRNCRVEELLYPASGEVDMRKVPDEVQKEINWEDFSQHLKTVRLMLEAKGVELGALVIFIADILDFDEEMAAIAQKIASDIRYMLLLNPEWGVKEVARELKSIKNSLNYFANIVYDRKGFEPAPGEINLLTYHKSKGLEFDTVYLSGMTSSDFPAVLSDRFLSDYWCLRPDYRNPVSVMKVEVDRLKGSGEVDDPGKMAKIEVIGERLRLLYVGITRAKENLLMTSHKEFLNRDLGKRMKTLPTQYLQEIGRFVEENRLDFERRKS